MTRKGMLLGAAVAVLLGGLARAGELPRLPHPLAMPQGGDSPGQVTFRHDSHVDSAKPACLTCHPQRFGILGRSTEKRATAITHSPMEKGAACGSCHGKQAFGFDDCTMCHAQ
jgi:c(7)-type cytochrome triheme protein